MNSPHDLLRDDGDRPREPRRERVEDYLDHVCAPLVGIVPHTERAALRVEVAGHLAALIDEYEEVGLEPEAATHAALREHGEPWSLGQAFLEEWARREPVGRLARGTNAGALRAFAW